MSSQANTNMLQAAGAAIIVALSFGYCIGYTSPALPDMEKLKIIDSETASWLGAVITIGGLMGCPLAGWTVEKYGRKLSLFFSCLFMTSGYVCILMGSASNINPMYIGRLLKGIGSGVSTVVMTVYISETSTKEMRGTLGTGVQFGITVGILLVYFLGFLFGWQGLTAIGILVPSAAIFLLLKVPETPRWYLIRGRRAEAVRALQWLRGTMDVEEELGDIEESLPDKNDVVEWSEFLKPEVFRPLQVSMIVLALQQCTGINVVMFYTVSIFESAGYKSSGNLATVVIGAVQVVATAGAVYLMDRAGRRPLLLFSGAGMAIACFTLGLFYHWNALGQAENISWLALAALILYIVAFSLGWGPIPALLMSEVFPVRVRGTASGIAAMGNWGTAFIITKSFSIIVSSFGQSGAFVLFGAFTALALGFVWKFVPETKGRSLEDIELYFLGRVVRGV